MATISITPSSPASPPITRMTSHPPPSPPTPGDTSSTSAKRLRSCLSPTRRLTDTAAPPIGAPFPTTVATCSNAGTSMSGSMDEPSLTFSSSPMTSRSTSFSSQDGVEVVERWRRSKSVRWDENEGCITPAYFSTWSADDYDRSPLDPPKPEERACLMPERGSRCLSPLNCFTDAAEPPPFFASPTSIAAPSSIAGGTAPLPQPPAMASVYQNGFARCERIANDEDDAEAAEGSEAEADADADADADEDKEWQECMERRRMMFAQMSRQQRDEGDGVSGGCRRFEGYTSLSATLLAMLEESGLDGGQARDTATPVGTPQEGTLDEVFKRGRPAMVRMVERRVSPMRQSFSIHDDDEEDEEEEDDAERREDEGDDEGDADVEVNEQTPPTAETVFAALRAFRMGPGRELRTGAEERDTE